MMIPFNPVNMEKVTWCATCDYTQGSHEHLSSKEAELWAGSIVCLRDVLEACRRQEAYVLGAILGATDQTAAEKSNSVCLGTYTPDLHRASKVSFYFTQGERQLTVPWSLLRLGLTPVWSARYFVSSSGPDQLEYKGLAVVCGCGN